MSNFIKTFFFIGDILLLNFSISFSVYYLADYSPAIVVDENMTYLFMYSNLAWLFLLIVSNPYHIQTWHIPKIIKSQIAFLSIHLLVVIALNIFFNTRYSIIQIGLIYTLFVSLFFIWKLTLLYFRKIFLSRRLLKNYILIGKNELSYKVREYYLVNPEKGKRFFGYFDYEPGSLHLDQLREFCLTRDIHEVYCCVHHLKKTELHQIINFGLTSLISVRLLLDSHNTTARQSIRLADYDDPPNVGIAVIPLDDSVQQAVKRGFDLIFSFCVAVFILLWLIPVVGMMIILDSPGPVFFTQWRNGKENKPFRCLKFRTMRVNVEADSKISTREDPRITRLGRFLRETSIDELPQFLNVLTGSMSVVGPRPYMLKMTEDYCQLIHGFSGRHYVKPGITGLSQCLGLRGSKTGDILKDLEHMQSRIKIDLYYIENWSFTLDIKIIFRTLIILLKN